MYEVPPRLKSGNSKDTWQLINMGWKIRKLGKKNMREFLRVIGLNIADELEDNLSDNTLMGLLAHEAILGSNLGLDLQDPYYRFFIDKLYRTDFLHQKNMIFIN